MPHRPLLIAITLILAGILVPFGIWGEHFDAIFSLSGTQQWITSHGSWAWLAGVLLLMSDLLLPVPSTIIMSALGLIYGWWQGGLLASSGAFCAGMLAYATCRWLGRPAAFWLAGQHALERGERLFQKHGGWLVALSRWMPVLPEAIACLAGLVRMEVMAFTLALACGCVPVGFVFAAIGALGKSSPSLAICLSALLPVLLWLVARRWLKHKA
jgi:uncharacterized membrane protein YdjX (TVP38/TMEM64 family)